METRQVGPFAWEVPIGTVDGMRVPGLVFGSDELMRKAVDDRAVLQVANVATLPGIVRASLAMPDIHWGYGFPIGGVAATDPEADGVISPGGVGFDIACGVRLLRSDLEWERDVRPVVRELVSALGVRVPRGVGTKGRMSLSRAEVVRVLREGVRFPLSRGVGDERDAALCEDGGVLEDASPDDVSDRAIERGRSQLGSLGSGNHFLEVQVVEEVLDPSAAGVLGLFTGQVCLMLHSGSRGLGHQVCTDHVKTMDGLMRRLGIEVPDRQLACVPLGHEAAARYLGAMNAAANFARANRHVLADAAREAFEHVFRRSAADLGLALVYDVAHNLAKLEDHVVDGRRRRLCVHRKGATRAFGPGHPGVPAAYRSIGQPVLIPGSMGTASYVLVGTEEAAERSFSSTCHGAGRAMSRTQAKKIMRGADLARSLEAEGIELAPAHWGLLSEEAPYAYKDVAEVVRACEGAGLTRTVARLRPVGVVKG
ncbi:MAG TPA: RtcB family protein [Actinomycetota bacterium]|nr:RtcB family protein [Actinomycetota bacterium]